MGVAVQSMAQRWLHRPMPGGEEHASRGGLAPQGLRPAVIVLVRRVRVWFGARNGQNSRGGGFCPTTLEVPYSSSWPKGSNHVCPTFFVLEHVSSGRSAALEALDMVLLG